MSETVKQTQMIDLGGGWQAEICRPPNWVSALWFRTLNKGKEPHEVAEEAAALEQGRDDSLPPAEGQAKAQRVRLKSEHLEVWERQVYPHVVLRFVRPDGESIARDQVWLGDLGLNRFYRLMGAVSRFVRETDDSFRDDTEGTE